jgi:hypothetical protein
MGTSTDAELIYGVCLDDWDECGYEELPFAAGDEDGFEDTLARLAGAPSYGEGEFEVIYPQRKAATDASPLMLLRHCSHDYPMYILGLKATYKSASRGGAVEFDSLDEPSVEDVQALYAFMREHGIEGDVKWVLCSMWG